MKTVLRALLTASLGALVAVALPREGLIEASTRIMPFLSLLMAGILPAMMLTVSILKGDDLSVKAVDEYAIALSFQLRFWASLFASCAWAAGCLVLLVVFSKLAEPTYVLGPITIAREAVAAIFTLLFGGGLGLLIARLWPAYRGVVSLLNFNVKIAKAKAQKSVENSLADLTVFESGSE